MMLASHNDRDRLEYPNEKGLVKDEIEFALKRPSLAPLKSILEKVNSNTDGLISFFYHVSTFEAVHHFSSGNLKVSKNCGMTFSRLKHRGYGQKLVV